MGKGIQTKTLILVATAAVLGGSLYVLQEQLPPPATEEVATPSEPLFAVQESEITNLVIRQGSEILKLKRDEAGAWQILEPIEKAAETGTVVFLLNLLSTVRVDKSLSVPLAEVQDFGLAEPQAAIEFTTTDQVNHRLLLGGLTFDQNQLYAQADPPLIPTDPLSVVVVPLQFLDAVNQPLTAWEAQEPQATEPSPAPETPAVGPDQPEN